MQRNPKLSLRRGDATANVRMDSATQETVEQYFALLKEVLEEHHLMDKPSHINNMDESGMPLDHRPPQIVAKKGKGKLDTEFPGIRSRSPLLAAPVLWDRLSHQWSFLTQRILILSG